MCAGGIVENTQMQFLCGNNGILKDSQKIQKRCNKTNQNVLR